jgi:hypothetical protein
MYNLNEREKLVIRMGLTMLYNDYKEILTQSPDDIENCKTAVKRMEEIRMLKSKLKES